jgi:secondary thiamine-phosphate synthase enzyme
MRVVCHKEGVEPCTCDAHYCLDFGQFCKTLYFRLYSAEKLMRSGTSLGIHRLKLHETKPGSDAQPKMAKVQTSAVFINDDESGLHHDYEVWLERLAPHAPIDQYWHNRTGEDNADAHLKRQVMGREVVVAVTNGRLDFGTWERIFYGEFDGRRRKRVLVKIIGE